LFHSGFRIKPDNKSITLIVMESGQFVSIAVKDEGIGISKDKVSSIFERFTTVSKENDMQPSIKALANGDVSLPNDG
jgi:signal transduction histidine kinase